MVESREGIEEQTGTGAPRSADGTVRQPSKSGDEAPAENMNRSGSGGTGGGSEPSNESDSSTGESMEELLGE